MMKHRGVYWRKQSEKFVVSFKSNGKTKTYGLFASFEDAVKRAEEVWSTLPIANRSQCVCDDCCVLMSNQLFDWGKSTCKACRRTQKRIQQTLKRKCKTCECDFVSKDKRQIVCSKECGHKGRKRERSVFKCSVCGNAVTRYADHLESYSSVACSARCQKVIAAKAGASISKANIDYEKRSKEARAKWHKTRSNTRRTKNEWVRTCGKQASKIKHSNAELSEWQVRCHNAVTALGQREYDIGSVTTKNETDGIDTWEQSISRAFSMRHQKPQKIWNKKCSSIAANLKLRKRKQTPVH